VDTEIKNIFTDVELGFSVLNSMKISVTYEGNYWLQVREKMTENKSKTVNNTFR